MMRMLIRGLGLCDQGPGRNSPSSLEDFPKEAVNKAGPGRPVKVKSVVSTRARSASKTFQNGLVSLHSRPSMDVAATHVAAI